MRAPLLTLAMVCALTPAAWAQDAKQAESWLDELYADVADDLADGKPLVVQVHVPLCDNNIITCGGHGLGDGDNPRTNLYWKTSGGFLGWFGRRDSGWKQVMDRPADGDVLDVRVWKKTVKPGGALARRGVRRSFPVYVVAYAWRGSAIRDAMDAYTRDLWGGEARALELDDGTELAAGGQAHIVAYVGHNGWMDVSTYEFENVAGNAKPSRHKKGTVAVACITESYLADDVSAPSRVPLLMTRTLLFAGAHSFEGAVTAFASGRSLAEIRRSAIRAYARGQGKSEGKVAGAFTNPSHARWKHR
jgi:hypothetical protein